MKYSPELTAEVCKYISNGLSQVDACTMVDISEDTFYRWAKEKPEFSEQLKKATIRFKLYHLMNIGKHAEVSFPASAWLLERKFSSEFSQNKDLYERLDAIEKRLTEMEVKK